MQYNTQDGKPFPDPKPPAPVPADLLLDCILRLDMQFQITYASHAVDVILGIPAAALLGTPLSDHTTEAGLRGFREVLAGLLAGADRTADITHTIDLRHASGHLVPCEFHGRLVLDRNGEPVELVGIMRDITNRRRDEQRERQADQRRYETHKMQAIAQLAGGIVNDLEALLQALDNCLSADAHPELIPLREQAAERISQLRTLAGRQDLELRNLDVDDLVADTIASLESELPTGLSIVHQRRSCGSTTWADPKQITRVLRTLCVNARDAMPEGGVITITTGLCETAPEIDRPPAAVLRHWVTIEVRDFGQGLDSATRERILDPFFTTKTGRGGLSLPLAHGIIDQHGGRLEVDSEPGLGSTFRVLLPARFTGTQEAIVEEEATALPTILLVDDDPDIRRYCSKILGAGGFRVVTCVDGVEALAYIAGDDPVDLVVLDWALPGLDGRRVREQLTRRYLHLPLLIISGHMRQDYESLGGIDHETPWLLKPFTPNALLSAVRGLLPADTAGR